MSDESEARAERRRRGEPWLLADGLVRRHAHCRVGTSLVPVMPITCAVGSCLFSRKDPSDRDTDLAGFSLGGNYCGSQRACRFYARHGCELRAIQRSSTWERCEIHRSYERRVGDRRTICGRSGNPNPSLRGRRRRLTLRPVAPRVNVCGNTVVDRLVAGRSREPQETAVRRSAARSRT
jgi:hypothetical protein